jgi:hypothetical protein
MLRGVGTRVLRATCSGTVARAVCAALIYVAFGCSPARSVESHPKTGLAEGVVTLENVPSPGVFLYRPRPADLRDAQERRVGSYRLLLGARQQRWLIGTKGELRAASQLAPEPLIDAGVSDGPAPYWFLGTSGRVYRASSVLGELGAAYDAPPEALVRVTSGRGVILGVDTRGHLQRSPDQGRTWSQANVAGRIADVALLPTGHGLLLASPEAYHVTEDAGETWQVVSAMPFGGLRLDVRDNAIDVLSVLGRSRWRPEHPSEFKPRAREKDSPPAFDAARLQRFASARAVTNGTAVLDGSFYAEVENVGNDLTLWRGKVTEALERVNVSVNGCREPRLSGSRAALLLVCGASSGKISALRIYKSANEGSAFTEEPYKLRGDVASLDVLPWKGGLVWTGICDPDGEATSCVPAGVFYSRSSGETTEFRELRLMGLAGVGLALTVSPATEQLLVFGGSSKGDELGLYVGDDPARPFDLQRIEEVRLPRSYGPSIVSLPAWGNDGFVSLSVFETRLGRARIVVANEHGELVQVRQGPSPSSHVTGVGMRVLAIEPRSGDVWESLDGGEGWEPIGKSPTSLCAPARQQACSVELVCFEQGCLIAEQLVRLGWHGQVPLPAPPEEVPELAPKVALQTPLVCRVNEDARWRSVPGGQIPEATGASLRDVDWFTHHVDWSTGSVIAYEMDMGGPGGVAREEVVLERQKDPGQWVVFSSSQTEGVAALRSKIGGDTLDVAWRNLFESTTTRRAVLKMNGVPVAERWGYTPTRALAQAGQPGLVSIAAGGILVRPGVNETNARTWFVREDGQIQELPRMAWPEIAATGRTEMSRVGETPFALKLFRNGAAVVRARAVGQAWEVAAMSVGLDEPQRFNLRQSYEITYHQGVPHYHLWQLGETGGAWLFPLQERGAVFGTPLPAPTQASLGGEDEPRVCQAEERASARVVAPPESNTLHPVITRHNSEPTKYFITRNAVLYGTPDKPCVAVYEGESAARTKSEEWRVLVRPGRHQPSWMFRRVAGEPAFEYRPMTCEFDVHEPVPPEVSVLVDDGSN